MGRAITILLNGKKYTLEVQITSQTSVRFLLNNRAFLVEHIHEITSEQSLPQKLSPQKSLAATSTTSAALGKEKTILAPIPGTIIAITAAPGASVSAGQTLMRLEAMKMENNIVAPNNGIIKEIHVKEREEISEGQLLISFK